MSFASAPPLPPNASGRKPINLLRGWPAPSLLPPEALTAALSRALSDPAVAVPALQYGPDAGFQPLREELAALLTGFYGGTGSSVDEGTTDVADPSRICITGGASQSLANVLASFTHERVTRAVWMVAPCYFLACPIFEDAGFGQGRLRAVAENEDGVDLSMLERGIREVDVEWEREGRRKGEKNVRTPEHRKLYRHIIYLVPTCANPSGKTMSLSRRQGLVRLARRHDALIIADDVYDFLQWPVDGTATTTSSAPPAPFPPSNPSLRLPRLADIDRTLPSDPSHHHQHTFGNAISNGSFSKIVGPGVRTGWVDASPAFAHGLSQTGATCSGGAPSHVSAVMLWEMLRSGDLTRRLREVVLPALRERHRRAMGAVEAWLVPLGVKVRRSSLREGEEVAKGGGGGGSGNAVYGGYFIWLTLPVGVRGAVVAERARQAEALVVGAGALFEVYGDENAARFDREVRICFSWEDIEDVVEGVERLARAVKDVMEGKVQGELGAADNVHNDK